MIRLKARRVTILTDDDIAQVSGGGVTDGGEYDTFLTSVVHCSDGCESWGCESQGCTSFNCESVGCESNNCQSNGCESNHCNSNDCASNYCNSAGNCGSEGNCGTQPFTMIC